MGDIVACDLQVSTDLIQTTARAAGPAVVGLGPGWRGGSGIVIGTGRVLTAAHNLAREGAAVVFADGRRERARVVAVDRDLDLAVLELDTGDAPALRIAGADDADAADARGADAADAAGADAIGIGSAVIALARPGGRALRVTPGFVSSERRQVRGARGRRVPAIEHTAPLPRGSSGGPLLDAGGRLIGINLIRLEGGLIVALDAVALAADIARLGAGEAPRRRRLGIAVAPPHVARRLRRAVGLPEETGVLVRGVEEGSAAEQAGLERGDLIVALGGKPLEQIDDLYAALDAATDALELIVLRGTAERAVRVEFAVDTNPERGQTPGDAADAP
jgi:serine protease Do